MPEILHQVLLERERERERDRERGGGGGELTVLDGLLKRSLHGVAKSSAELSVRGLLTGGSPANSLLDEDLVSLFNLDFIAGPRFSPFKIVFFSDMLQEKGPSSFAFPTAFRCFQLSLTAFQKFDTKTPYLN